MKRREFRIGRLTGAAALAVLMSAWAIPEAAAQQGAPAPTPTPRPAPSIITLPGANNFDLRPSGAQPVRPTVQPTPTPRPTPAPSAAAPPSARATPAPRPAATPAVRAAQPAVQPAAAPTPAASPPAQATPLAPPLALPTPTPLAAPAATPAAPVAAEGGIPWLWILTGAAMASVLVLLGWLLGRRRRAEPPARPVAVAPPRPAAPPSPPPAAAPPPPPAPRPAPPRPALPLDPVIVELRPIALEIAENGVIFDFELAVMNATNAPVEGLRLAYGMMSAHEDQDRMIAGFHATRLPPVAEPFTLAPREGMRIPGRVGLEGPRINVIEVGGRPMLVPLLMVDLRWQAGLSLKHQGTDFMIGIGRQGEKLGPVWLDRGAQRHERVNANRYVAKRVAVAAE